MRAFYVICFFVLGTIFGSFYNVLGLRIVNHESIIKPRSHCEKCGHILAWYELIPIFCGLLFLISYYSFGFSYNLLIALIISSLLIIVTVSDITYMIIPDRFIVICSILVIIIKAIFCPLNTFLYSLLSGIASFAVMFAIMKFGNYVFKKETLGGADVKLMFFVGLCLEPFLSLLVIVFASFIALPVSLLLLVKEKEHAIPFGPFIVIALMIVFLMKVDTMKVINFLLGR